MRGRKQDWKSKGLGALTGGMINKNLLRKPGGHN